MLRHFFNEVRRVVRAETKVHGRLRRHLGTLFVLTIGIDVICAVLVYVFEHHAKASQVKSFGSAIFWTTTQLLTVSSQMSNPITTPARLLDVFMEFWAVTFVTSMAAAIGAFLVKRGESAKHL